MAFFEIWAFSSAVWRGDTLTLKSVYSGLYVCVQPTPSSPTKSNVVKIRNVALSFQSSASCGLEAAIQRSTEAAEAHDTTAGNWFCFVNTAASVFNPQSRPSSAGSCDPSKCAVPFDV